MTADLFYFKPSPTENSELIVFFPGWGFPGRIVDLIPCLAGHTLIAPRFYLPSPSLIQELTIFLRRHNISNIILVGWSMGANQALDFALERPILVSRLHLLGMRNTWPISEIETIRTNLHAEPKSFLDDFYRKCFLGHKKAYKQFIHEIRDNIIAEPDLDILDAGLDYLAAYNLPDKKISNLDITVIHGEKDIIAPVVQLPRIINSQVRVISNGGHMCFLAADFSLPCRRAKEAVRLKFSRAAVSYDEYADVQKETAAYLAELLPRNRAGTILEIGCGTGNYTSLLHDKYPAARICALDFAEAMVEQAGRKIRSEQIDFLCLDGEKYLAGEKKFDLITSNGALQWFEQPHKAFARIGKKIKENGWFICSIFGPETLVELQNAFSNVLGSHVQLAAASFLNREQLQKSLVQIFSHVEITELRLSRRYGSLLELLRHLQKTGTSGFQPSGPILNRRLIRELDKWFADRQGYSITYQIFLLRAHSKNNFTL